jgi:hypothetical protein
MRTATIVAALAVLWAQPVWAQGTTGEFAGSFTGAATDIVGIEYQPSGIMADGAYFFSEMVGVTAEASYATGSNLVADVNTATVAGGIRIRFPTDSFFKPSLRGVVGLGRISADTILGAGSTNEIAVIVGASLDFGITDSLAIRVQPDVLIVEHFDPVMFRFGFGLAYSFGGPVSSTRAPAPERPAPVAPVAAAPVRPEPVAAQPEPAQTIAAGAIPEGTAPPHQLSQSAGWTTLTGLGVGYEWSTMVRNNNAIARTARATATLYDAGGAPLFTQEASGPIPAGATVTLGATGELSRAIAQRGDHWTITVAWVAQ